MGIELDVVTIKNKCIAGNYGYLESKLRVILGTGRKLPEATGCLSTGQVGCLEIHSLIQPLQKACSQAAAYNKLQNDVKTIRKILMSSELL